MADARSLVDPTLRGRALAKRVVETIELFPEKHEQDIWVGVPLVEDGETVLNWNGYIQATPEQVIESCGTSACLAGWSVLLTGHTYNRGRVEGVPSKCTCCGDAAVEEYAAELLELDYQQADNLFMDMNERSALERLRTYAETGELPWKDNNDD